MDETALAFATPMDRAAAGASIDPLDRIAVRDYVREIEIGAFQAERGVTQRVRFNVVLEVSHHTAAQDDDVDKVISYDMITEAIDTQLRTERINLLETLAERIAERCLSNARVVRAFVRLEKLDRIPGSLGVEIVRGSRVGAALRLRPVDPAPVQRLQVPHPLVVYLDPQVVAGPHLPAWLDLIQASGQPAVICLGGSTAPAPRASHPLAQRRIDLLAIEQNAWVLAALDRRCVVVDSRTELDWAMKHGQLSVWAPSRIVLDAVEAPEFDRDRPEGLAQWFARDFDAQALVIVGGQHLAQAGDLPTSWRAPGDLRPLLPAKAG